MTTIMVKASVKITLGKLVQTAAVNEQSARSKAFSAICFESLRRHRNGDWGDVNEEDAAENDFAATRNLRILSVYNLPKFVSQKGDKIWIITEADRLSTCILYPSEY